MLLTASEDDFDLWKGHKDRSALGWSTLFGVTSWRLIVVVDESKVWWLRKNQELFLVGPRHNLPPSIDHSGTTGMKRAFRMVDAFRVSVPIELMSMSFRPVSAGVISGDGGFGSTEEQTDGQDRPPHQQQDFRRTAVGSCLFLSFLDTANDLVLSQVKNVLPQGSSFGRCARLSHVYSNAQLF